MRRLASLLIAALLGVACSLPDVPVPLDGFDARPSEAGAMPGRFAAGDDASAGSEAGLDGPDDAATLSDAGTGIVGVPGSSCSSAGAVACNGNAQKVTLVCVSGAWTVAST